MKTLRSLPGRPATSPRHYAALFLRLASLALVLCLLPACRSATPTPQGQLIGKPFPSVQGKSLSGEPRRIPEDLAGSPHIVLIAFQQRTQFDLDRWILALVQLQTPIPVIELATIEGLVPGLFSGPIDEGMRGGIPPEDWAKVITIYEDAPKVAGFVGRDQPQRGRIILLDAAGNIAWFYDGGYSPRAALELDRLARQLADIRTPATTPKSAADRQPPPSQPPE